MHSGTNYHAGTSRLHKTQSFQQRSRATLINVPTLHIHPNAFVPYRKRRVLGNGPNWGTTLTLFNTLRLDHFTENIHLVFIFEHILFVLDENEHQYEKSCAKSYNSFTIIFPVYKQIELTLAGLTYLIGENGNALWPPEGLSLLQDFLLLMTLHLSDLISEGTTKYQENSPDHCTWTKKTHSGIQK